MYFILRSNMRFIKLLVTIIVITYLIALNGLEAAEPSDGFENGEKCVFERRNMAKLLTSDSSISMTLKSAPQNPSIFKFPQDHCPIFFTLGILNEFNRQRIEEHYPPLALSQKTSEAAQAWASSNRKEHVYEKPSFARYGQLIWGKYSRDSLEEMQIGFWEPFENKFWGKGILPKYTASHTRRFTETEWQNTKDIGIGCSSWRYPGGDVITNIAVFFNTWTRKDDQENGQTSFLEPSEQLIKFSVAQSFCPASLSYSIFQQINSQREKANLPTVEWSDIIADEANILATKMGSDGKQPKTQLGYLTWARWWDSINEPSLAVSVEEIFDEKWGSQVIPKKNDFEEREYSDIEWKLIEKIGIGCSVHRKSRYSPGVKLQVIALFK